MRLLEFKARDVYGYLNLSIDFTSTPTILIGPNGSGKTTALRMIQALLGPSLPELLNTEFSVATLIFEDQASPRHLIARKTRRTLTLQLSGVADELTIPVDILKSVDPEVAGYSAPTDVRRALFVKYSDSPVFRAISEIHSPVFLGLERTDPALRDESAKNAYYREMGVIDKRPRRASVDSGLRSLSESKDLVSKAFRRVLRIREHHGMRLRRKLLLTGFEYIKLSDSYSLFPRGELFASEQEMHAKRDELLAALGSIGVDRADAEKELDPFFNQVLGLQRRLARMEKSPENPDHGETILEAMVNRANLARLQALIATVRDHNERGLALSQRFNNFVSTINGFMADSRKEIEIDPIGTVRVKRPDKVEIPVEALSSGERQILVIFAHLYFNSFGERSSVFIIDEPELSLHLRWQEVLLHRMIESNPRAQIVVATHSPEVVGEFEQHCVEF